MSVRDLLLMGVIFGALPFMLRRPFIGLLFWVWIGVMNPQQLVWTTRGEIPFAMMVAIATFLGMLFNRDQLRFKGGGELAILVLLFFWMSLTTIFAFYPDQAFSLWQRVAKIQLMAFVAVFLVNSKRQLDAVLWVIALSIGYYGIKGGAFTLLTGGAYKVWGPADSVIGDNNPLALALVMTVPLFVYLRSQTTNKWVRRGVLGAIALSCVSALGSHSRGALLAVSAMLFFLWLKSTRKLLFGIVLILLVPTMIAFMPENWTNRMKTIETYQEDTSAMQRLNAWTTAIIIANDRPLVGGGFQMYSAETSARYSPQPDWVFVAHSIYFQVLGEHGWVALALYLALWVAVWRRCARLIKVSRGRADLAWAGTLGAMMQVSVIGYLVGGTFLSLAYWDVPYYEVALVVVASWLVRQGGAAENTTGRAPVQPGSRTTTSASSPQQSPV